MVDIRQEPFTLEFYEECKETFEEHLRELQVFEDYEPCVDPIAYIRASNMGDLALVVARDEGKVVGYLGCWIVPNVNYEHLTAQQAGIYLNEEYRKGFLAIKMIRECERVLKEEYDVKDIILISTVKKDISSLFKYLKYQESETLYTRRL
jgi:hypothetical protein